jgi:membrane associated rhomboid family serine protease
MLSDRPYMRGDYPREKTSVLVWLICGIVAGFILQIIISAVGLDGRQSLLNEFSLSIQGLKAGHIWTLFTHSFLHDQHYLFHLVVNLLGLYFLGRELLPTLGARRFVGLYSGAILAGALMWTLVHWRLGGEYYGATAGVDALLIVFASFYPHRRLDFLLFFVFPISLKPKHIAWALVGFDLFGLFVYEMRNAPSPFQFTFANSAHLGGMLAGWIYFRYFHDIPWQAAAPQADNEMPRRIKRGAKNAAPALPAFQIDTSNPSDVRAEVDRILDKINSHGFHTLTAEEKRLLDDAKDLLSRR